MSEDLESRLRAALRPVAPDEAFTQDLLARVTAHQGAPSKDRGAGRHARRAPAWWLAAGVAASLLVTAGIQHRLRQQHELAAGVEARRQVIQALRVTSQKLDLAYEAIKNQSLAPADEKPG